MSETLIRPVSSEIKPVLSDISTIFGRKFEFLISPELHIRILFGRASYGFSELVDLREDSEHTSLHINVFPHQFHTDLVRAQRFFVDDGTLCCSNKQVSELSTTEIPTPREYALEEPHQLRKVEGINYIFVVGEKNEDVFVDGWLKETQSPRWRITTPVDRKSDGNQIIPSLLVLSTRLLIFE